MQASWCWRCKLDRRTTPANATTAVPEEKEMEQPELSDQGYWYIAVRYDESMVSLFLFFSVVTSQTLLKLAGHLGHLEAEKLAVHLYVDYCHIAALRQQYPDDPEMYAYKLLMKWWETSDDSDQEQWDLLVGALRSSGLGNLAVALVVNNNQGENFLPLFRTSSLSFPPAFVFTLFLSLLMISSFLSHFHPSMFKFDISCLFTCDLVKMKLYCMHYEIAYYYTHRLKKSIFYQCN